MGNGNENEAEYRSFELKMKYLKKALDE